MLFFLIQKQRGERKERKRKKTNNFIVNLIAEQVKPNTIIQWSHTGGGEKRRKQIQTSKTKQKRNISISQNCTLSVV